jgi:hypothetical protein
MADSVRALMDEIDDGLHSGPLPVSFGPSAAERRERFKSEGVPTVQRRDPIEESKAKSRRQARAHDAVYRRRMR